MSCWWRRLNGTKYSNNLEKSTEMIPGGAVPMALSYILAYPKAISDSMQKEITQTKKGRNESEIKANLWTKKHHHQNK